MVGERCVVASVTLVKASPTISMNLMIAKSRTSSAARSAAQLSRAIPATLRHLIRPLQSHSVTLIPNRAVWRSDLAQELPFVLSCFRTASRLPKPEARSPKPEARSPKPEALNIPDPRALSADLFGEIITTETDTTEIDTT